jgi:pyridoxamine 5'-phosphate oxidase
MLEFAPKTNPIEIFKAWFDEAVETANYDATAMTLATADRQGRPSARVLLLKEVDSAGFVFFTNYESRKAKELFENPYASIVFFWPHLGKQVRVRGKVDKVSAEDSDAYFQTRPRGSQVGAWASPQSREIPDKAFLEKTCKDIDGKYDGKKIPCPPFWGGFRLVPEEIEFWLAGENRLHDRFLYTNVNPPLQSNDSLKTSDSLAVKDQWQIKRLAP